MYDEVKAFGAAMDAAQEAFYAAKFPMSGEHDPSICPLCIRDAAVDAAWPLLAGAADPLVRWIAENCRSAIFEAAVILRALPATMAELDQIAEDEDWCLMWGEFRLKAERAGVLPDQAMAETSER